MKIAGKFLILLCFLSFCLAASASAGEARDRFFDANVYYDKADYRQAAEIYESLLAGDVISGNIYYNLGNCYYKMGKIGRALLNYERAAAYIPHSEDLFFNISFVRSALDFKQPGETLSLARKIWLKLRDYFSINFWFFSSAVLFAVFCLVLSAGFLMPRYRSRANIAAIALAAVLLFTFITFFDVYHDRAGYKPGIILSETDVRYSPSFSGAVGFKVPQGIKANIVRMQGDWTYIRLNKQKSGWIESEAIEAI